MDKIYSRKRIHLPKFIFLKGDPKQERRRKKVIKIGIVLMVAITTSWYVIRSVSPVFDKLCKTEAKSIATKISNEKATEVMKKYKYEDLVTIMKDGEGNVTAMKANVIPINEIISDVPNEIQDELNNGTKNNIAIRLGTFTGSKLLSGRGPNVNIRISNIGEVQTDLRSEFKQAGINQTLHRIYLQVDCKVAILTPFHTIEEEISNQVLLAENVIVGTVPSSFYNLEGLDGSKDALELVE